MYAPRKVFIKENGEYLELTYEAYCTRCETDPFYQNRRFLPLHGMLMEVSEEEYVQFYRQKNRQKYLQLKLPTTWPGNGPPIPAQCVGLR